MSKSDGFYSLTEALEKIKKLLPIPKPGKDQEKKNKQATLMASIWRNWRNN